MKGTLPLKWLVALCVLECVSAAASPSSPAPKFGAATIDGSGSGEGSPESSHPPRDCALTLSLTPTLTLTPTLVQS